MGKSVVADAGPLIAFGRIEKRELLPQVLGEVFVPHTVATECLTEYLRSTTRRMQRSSGIDVYKRQAHSQAEPEPSRAEN